MFKHKPNKGLLKRIRITKSGKVKFRRAFGRHLRSHKSGSTLRGYRRPAYAKATDMKAFERMLGRRVRSDAAGTASEAAE